jgi:hypothetical protein
VLIMFQSLMISSETIKEGRVQAGRTSARRSVDRGLVARGGAFKTNMASSPCSNGRRPSWRLIYRSESGQVPSQSLFRTVLVLVYRLGLHLNVTIPWPMTGRCRSRCVARRWTVLLRLRRLGLLAIGRRGRGQAASWRLQVPAGTVGHWPRPGPARLLRRHGLYAGVGAPGPASASGVRGRRWPRAVLWAERMRIPGSRIRTFEV